jgi:hypothetical protein
VRGAYLWRVVGSVLQRWSVTDGSLVTHDLSVPPGRDVVATAGPSGIWFLGPSVPDGTVSTLTRIAGDGSTMTTGG